MPTYSSICHECGEQHTYFAKLADYKNTPFCCGKQTEKTLDTPAVVGVWTGHRGFYAPDGKNGGVGTWIESAQDEARWMKANNKMRAEEGNQEARIQRANKKAENDKKLTQQVTDATRKVLAKHKRK